MRFSNENLIKMTTQTQTTRGSCSSQTSWNKLKNIKSSSSSTTTASSSIMMTNQNNNETPLIKYYKTNKQQQFITTSGRKTKRSLISKSPTITFGELKQRRHRSSSSNRAVLSSSTASSSLYSSSIHSFSKQNQSTTIGTQYPPYLMDQSIQTSIFNDKINYHKVNACLQATEQDIQNEQKKLKKKKKKKKEEEEIKFFYKSLPDLSFLKVYKDPPRPSAAVVGMKSKDEEIKLLISSTSIDKQRKTLKSIKRYRQIKQNTEPCGAQITPSESFSSKTTAAAAVPTSTNSSSSSNSSGYISADKIHQQQQNQLKIINSTQKPAAAVPLKSCLKRKDSALSNSSEYQKPTVRRYNSVLANNNKHFGGGGGIIIISNDKLNSIPIYIKSIGWLFTCDLKTLKSYKNLKINEQKVLTIDTNKINIIKEDVEEGEMDGEDGEERGELKRNHSHSDNNIDRIKFVSFNHRSSADNPSYLLKYNTLIQLLNKKTTNCSSNRIEKLKKSNNVYIDADSISLASLTESPPNEFKFYEEEEEEKEEFDHNLQTIDLNYYFTSSQQQQIFSELKVLIFQLNEINLKEQVSGSFLLLA